MNPKKIDCYLNTTQSYALRNNDIELVDYVQQQIIESPNDPNVAKFFVAERAFYQKRYQVALKNYLQAKEIPNFHFFCFRASAYVSLMMDQKEKALHFAKKALSIKPEDYATLKILIDIYTTIDEEDKADVISEKIQSLLDSELEASYSNSEEEEEVHHHIPVGKDEMDELSQIFSDCEKNEEPLFSLENQHNINEVNTPCGDLHSTAEDDFIMPAGFELFSHSASKEQIDMSLTQRLYSFANDEIETPPQQHKKNNLDTNLKIYSTRFDMRDPLTSNFLLSFDGWRSNDDDYSLIQKIVESKSSGCFLHWNGHGIAVNPGNHFIENIHNNKLFFYDLNTIIITKTESLQTLSQIVSLCENLDHKINFHLHPDLFDHFSSVNKKMAPNLHKLSFSHCFQNIYKDENNRVSYLCLNENLQLELSYEDKKSTVLTFAGDVTSKGNCFQRLGPSQVLITESRIPIASDRLQQLVSIVRPEIFLCSEFNYRQDERLEIVKSIRGLIGEDAIVLPTEIDFLMDLDSLAVRASDNSKYILPKDIILYQQMDGQHSIKYFSKKNLV